MMTVINYAAPGPLTGLPELGQISAAPALRGEGPGTVP